MMLKLKLYLVITILGILALLAGACAQTIPTPAPAPIPIPTPAPAPSGTVEVYVTDAPPRDEVTSILVMASKIEIHKAVAEQEQSGSSTQTQEQEQQQTQQGEGEWITLDIADNVTPFDLISLKIRGIEEFFASSQVEAGKYTQIRLTIDKVEVTLGNGEPQEATVPSNELKIVHPFDVMTGETTAIVLDFDADKSVTVTGAGNILVKPVVKLAVRQEKPQKTTTEQTAVEVSCDDFVNVQHVSKEMEVAIGDKFAVTLCSNPTTGFKWELVEIADQTTLELVDSKYEPGEKARQKPPVPGAGGEEIWTFKALKEGESIISMEYSQPWEGGEKAIWTFVLTVTIK